MTITTLSNYFVVSPSAQQTRENFTGDNEHTRIYIIYIYKHTRIQRDGPTRELTNSERLAILVDDSRTTKKLELYTVPAYIALSLSITGKSTAATKASIVQSPHDHIL